MNTPLNNTSLSLHPLPSIEELAKCLCFLSVDMVEKANSGHPGMPMGMADVVTILWREFLVFDASAPHWPNRDRFVLSAGHGSALLYSLLYLTGYEDMTLDQLQNFRQWGSITAGHPEYGIANGIETTTGPLGQGFATGVGMAIAEKHLNAEFGDDLIHHKIYVLASDGDLMEGISQEALSLAGHLKLNNLVVLYDDNHITIDGSTDLSFSDLTGGRFEASHWQVFKVDGHNGDQIRHALRQAQTSDRPVLIRCRTTIAKGAPTKAGTSASHGSPLGKEEIQTMRTQLDWPYGPFEIPDLLLACWREAGKRHQSNRKAWEQNLEIHLMRTEFERRSQRLLPNGMKDVFETLAQNFLQSPSQKATRQLSQLVLTEIAPHMPELIGGSADLMGSTNTKVPSQSFFSKENYEGNFVNYGIREHAMAAIMNGLSLSGLRPYGGTFLIFSDYMRPSIRLAALMHQPVIYVLTHDSIGLGEDGPTHQPIEHLASLRAMPNLNVFRPADGVEVVECWQLALESRSTPSVIALTRQAIHPVRLAAGEKVTENLSRKGAYLVKESKRTGSRDVTLIATGSEVALALHVAHRLEEEGKTVAVVSMPCTRLFDQQAYDYQESVLGKTGMRVVIEAASSFGWHRYLRPQDITCCIDTFGASAPAERLFDHYGLTVDKILKRIKAVLTS